MVHPEVKKLLQEVFSRWGEKESKRAGEYPEVYLVSLLENIKEELPVVSAILYFTVGMAGFGSDTERFQQMLARVQPTEKAQSHKVGKKPLKRQQREKVLA